MNLMDFGHRLKINKMEYVDYLHKYMAETIVIYRLLGLRSPASIDVNIIDNGVEYIFIGTVDLKEYIRDALSTSIVMSYGKNLLVRFRESGDTCVISMMDAEQI